MVGNRSIPLEPIEATDTEIRVVVGALPPNTGPGTIMAELGNGNRGIWEPIFDDIVVDEPVWVWEKDNNIPGEGGAPFDPQDPPADPFTTWYHSLEPEDGKLCIFIDGDWPQVSKVQISGRMRDHTTGKGYDQFHSCITITGPMSAVECAERICDAIKCAWSQLAGVDVICEVTPVGNNGAKITLAFENGSIDWGNITVCVADLSDGGYEQWKIDNGVTNDDEDLDQDGLAAIVEYHLGLNPNVPDPNPFNLDINSTSGEVIFEFIKGTSAADITVTVECSTDLINWEPIAINPLGDPIGLVNIIVEFEDRKFFRIRYTSP